MPDKISALVNTRWRKLRLRLINVGFDVADYLVLWLGVVLVYRIGLVAAIAYEPQIVGPLHWIETGANLGLLASFFGRVVLRSIKEQ
jgi:hypothetical protein